MAKTPRDVAEFMLESHGDSRWLDQEVIVKKIKKECGEEHTYRNKNGNLAISKAVLREFRKLTQDTHVWDRGYRAWRRRTARDGKDQRTVD